MSCGTNGHERAPTTANPAAMTTAAGRAPLTTVPRRLSRLLRVCLPTQPTGGLVRVETWPNLRFLDKLTCVGVRAMHLVAAPVCICDLEPGALLLPSKPLRSAVTQLTCNRLVVADRREGRRGCGPARRSP